MPLFDYRCTQCETCEEILLRGSEPEPTTCKACGGALERLVALPADLKRVDGFFHRDTFSDREIGQRGLTKYVNRGDGTYEKATGSGPARVGRDALLGKD